MPYGNKISNLSEVRSRRETTTRTNAAIGSQESADSRPTRPPYPNGQKPLCGSSYDTKKLWDAATGQETLTLRGHSDHPIHIASFSPDGKRIVSGSGDGGKQGEVNVWDAETGRKTLTLKGHTGSVLSVAFSADGKRIVSGSRDNTLKVWDATASAPSTSMP